MHKKSIGVRFIVASKRFSTKFISKAVFKAFKLIFHQIQVINHITILHLNNFGLLKIPIPFLKKVKRLIERVMKNYFNV